jgi:hypothetical protein
MEITVERHVSWRPDIYLRDAPSGDNAVVLKPLQFAIVLDETQFPEGQAVTLPQPDATYDAISVVRWSQSWHFLQPGGRELIIPAADWPGIRAQIADLHATYPHA